MRERSMVPMMGMVVAMAVVMAVVVAVAAVVVNRVPRWVVVAGGKVRKRAGYRFWPYR